MLDAAPSEHCFTEQYNNYLVYAIASLLIYVILTPIAILIALRNLAGRPERYFSERINAIYGMTLPLHHDVIGFLYARYQQESVDYEVYILLRYLSMECSRTFTVRKLCISIAYVFLTGVPQVQVLFAILVLLVSLFVQSWRNPFRNHLLNVVECTSLFTNVFILLVGNVFLVERDDNHRIVLTMLCFMSFGICIITLLVAMHKEHSAESVRKQMDAIRAEKQAEIDMNVSEL